jgi:hypothetical protein
MEVVDEDDDFDSSIDSKKLSSKVEEVFLIDFKELRYKSRHNSINSKETNSNFIWKYSASNEIDLLLKSPYSEKNNLKIFSHYKKGGFRNDN